MELTTTRRPNFHRIRNRYLSMTSHPTVMDVKWNRDYPTFPPEIFANIIDHQDYDGLPISSLVCTSWLSLARPRLFSSILFDERRVRMFIDDPNIIDSPLSTIRPLVKVVVIYDRHPLEYAEIVRLFSSFKTVTGLSYGDPYCVQKPIDERTTHDLAKMFPSITAVTVFTTFRDVKQMTTFICAFPSLITINMTAAIEGGSNLYSHIKCRPSPTLRVLKLDCGLHYILPWLLQLDSIPRITELTLKDFLADNLPYIAQLLSTLGPSLKRLTLVEKVSNFYSILSFHVIRSMALAVQSNSELEYLQFSCPTLSSIHALTALIVEIIISQATSLSLREVSISVGATLFDPIIWERTDEIVASLPSSRLEKVTVRTRRTGMDTSSIQQSFPLCHRLGLLRVVHYESDQIGTEFISHD